MGDDEFTQGRPHPMIDPSLRDARIRDEVADPTTAVVLFDVVLGYGSSADPTAGLLGVIGAAKAKATAAGRTVAFIGYVCGTDLDPQNREQGRGRSQVRRRAGGVVQRGGRRVVGGAHLRAQRSAVMKTLFQQDLKVVNVGLQGFADNIARGRRQGHPPELGAARRGGCRARLDAGQHDRRRAHRGSQPHRLRALSGRPAAPGGPRPGARRDPGARRSERRILHSGPPIAWADMCGPQQGAICRRDPLRGLGRHARGRGKAGGERRGGPGAVPRARRGRADGRHHQPVDAGVGRGEHRGRATAPSATSTRAWARCCASARIRPKSSTGCAGWAPSSSARCRSRCAAWPMRI